MNKYKNFIVYRFDYIDIWNQTYYYLFNKNKYTFIKYLDNVCCGRNDKNITDDIFKTILNL